MLAELRRSSISRGHRRHQQPVLSTHAGGHVLDQSRLKALAAQPAQARRINQPLAQLAHRNLSLTGQVGLGPPALRCCIRMPCCCCRRRRVLLGSTCRRCSGLRCNGLIGCRLSCLLLLLLIFPDALVAARLAWLHLLRRALLTLLIAAAKAGGCLMAALQAGRATGSEGVIR